jgi:hypothetical protein
MLPWGRTAAGCARHPRKALGDWQVTGVVSAISGTPIDFTANAALRCVRQVEHAKRDRHAEVLLRDRINALCSISALGASGGRWGGVERRGLLTGPAYYNLDASIVKIVRFGTRRAEIRADFFNALNIPHYANPNGTLGNANFGRITGILAQTERAIRFGGRFLF